MASSAFFFLLLVSFLVVANAQSTDGSQVFSLPGGILSLTSPDGTLPGTVYHTPTDSNSQSSTGTPTDTASQSGQTPQLSFRIPANSLMTTCTFANLSWLYIGPPGITMSLGVTNSGISQSAPAPTASSHTNTYTNGDSDLVRKGIPGHLTTSTGSGSDDSEGNVNQMLAASLDPDLRVFQWASVNISQGWYVAQATINGIVTLSAQFFVQNGTDVSCLSTSPPTGTTTTTSSMPTNSPTSSGSPQTTPGNELPVGGSSGSNLNKGAIAGGVIGGLAVLAAIIAAIFFYRYSSSSSSPRRPNGGFMGKWGNLGSFDSTSPAKVKQAKAKMYNNTGVGLAGLGIGTADPQRNLQPTRHNSQTESIGPIIYHDARRTPGGSSEEVFSPYDEKYMRSPFSDPGHGDGSEELGMITIGYDSPSSPSVGLATTGHATRHSSMNSTYSYAQNNNFSRPREQSTQYKASSSPQTFPESNTSNATIDTVSRRASSPIIPVQLSTSSLDHAPPSPAYPSGASAAMSAPQSGRPTPSPIPMAGIAGVGAGGSSPMTPTSRRTPRKPVPTYNPQDPSLLEPPTRIADVPTDVRNSDLQDLNHKGSFGSFKQVHILMPDMPPPQKD